MSCSASSSEIPERDYEALAKRNVVLEQELELIKFQFEQLKKHVYGKRSEKLHYESPGQERLFDLGEQPSILEEEDYVDIAPHKRKRRSKKSIPKDLPIDKEIYYPEETHCPDCGEELVEFSRDVRKELEFEPARFFMRHRETVHCSCPTCKEVRSGTTPSHCKPVIPGAQVGAGFLAHIATSKYCDHIPYYRQSKIYERDGVFVPDKTLCRYNLGIAEVLEPVAKAVKRKLIQLDYAQADETHLDVLDATKAANTHVGQLWVLNDPLSSLVCYEYHEGRTKECAGAFLAGFKGALQTDAYTCYSVHSGISLGCMAHARRYFLDAQKFAKKECNHILKSIGNLYRIERELRKLRPKLSDKDWFQRRLDVRKQRSKSILKKLQEYLALIKDNWLLEKHPMRKAVNYMLNRFGSFVVYTDNGRYEIDNNAAENRIRPIAQGRRNWLFAGSHRGAQASATIMTVVQSCQALKINPQKFLRDVLPRLADHDTKSLDGLTPFDWKPAVN